MMSSALTLITLFSFSTPSAFAAACNPDYSIASLARVKNLHIDSSVAEVRSAGILYELHMEISTEPSREERSAKNTIHLFTLAYASDSAEKAMSAIAYALRTKRAPLICVKIDPNSFYRYVTLPKQFELRLGALPGTYTIDLAQPFPTR